VYILEVVFWLATLTAQRPTSREMTSLSWTLVLVSRKLQFGGVEATDHVERVGHEGKRMDGIA
jgi:hypothetical protein